MKNERLPISFIVPVFNVKPYIRQCLNSIIEVNIEKEIILIDDGSIDGCKEILEEYQLNYPYITLVQQSNKGVSCARNIGINLAKGKYIQFVDSDDFLLTKDYKKLIDLANNSHADVLRGQCLWVFPGGKQMKVHQPTLSLLFDIPNDNLSVVANSNIFLKAHVKQHFPVVWLGFFRTEMLLNHRIFFEEDISAAEDSIFMLDAFSINVINVVEVFDAIYAYRFNSNGLSKDNNSLKRIIATFKAIDSLKARYKKYLLANNVNVCNAIDTVLTDCCVCVYRDYKNLSEEDKLKIDYLFSQDIVDRAEKFINN